jgi:tetratricopeptide (TPR) repeat protein
VSLTPSLALGWQYYQAGALAQAAQLCHEVLEADPASIEACYLLGLVRQASGRHAEAASCYQQALRLQPDLPQLHYCLGNTLAAQAQWQQAASSYREVIRLQPQHAEAHNNLGAMLAEEGKLAEALTSYQKALQLKPDYAEALYNQGNALRELSRFEEAVASYQRALEIKPGFAEARLNLGIARAARGELAEAVTAYQQALQLRPDYPEALNALGLILAQQGRLEEAVAHYEQALRLRPGFADAHNNRALAWLTLGDFPRGWPEYEWRWQLREVGRRPFVQPRWDGSLLAGRTILLHAEQGLGDTIQFIRYTPLVQSLGGKVIVECQAALVSLLSSCHGIDQLFPRGAALPAFDVQAPLLSLPGLLGTSLETIPAYIPYLHADPQRVERWRRELAAIRAFKIGIAWRGSSGYRWDRQRSVPLHHFARLAQIPGVQLVSLQKGEGSEQLASVAASFPVTDLAPRLDEDGGAFVDSAAVMKSMDLVISSDTAVAHLAGALGVPVWVALSVGSDWRWLRNREDTPWYPTMRLFRQAQEGKWDEVFEKMARAVLPTYR